MLGNGHNPMSSGDRASALDVQPAMIVQDPAPPGAL